MLIIYVFGVAQHTIINNQNNIRRNKKDVKKLFNMFYNNEKDYNIYTGIQYVAYDKEYTN